MLIFSVAIIVFNVNFVVIQNISASFSKLFPNYVPRPPLPRKERRPCEWAAGASVALEGAAGECLRMFYN